MSETFPQTSRTTATRGASQVSYERVTANAILDEAYVCHVSFLSTDPDTGQQEPRILPTLHVRLDDTLYLHGSTGSPPLLAARSADGLRVCVAITHLDGLVLARSQFSHSANYRSVVAHGQAYLVTDEAEKSLALTALVEKVVRGRAADSRPPNRRELAQTAVLALPLTEVSVKGRMGGVNDEPEDSTLDYWAGVLPLRTVVGPPEPELSVRVPLPSYLRTRRGPWLTPATMRGDHVILDALDMSHVDSLMRAVADEEVFRWLTRPLPTHTGAMAGEVRLALRMWEQGQRVPFVQRCARTGEVVGTTSYHAIDEENRSIAIGHTMLGRPWWRTGINTEAKLLLLTRAFEELGAVRVEWHTDLLNVRSQRAIERLGATREGVLRRHKPRADGTQRDTVLYAMTDEEWPTTQLRLRKMLRT